MKIAMTKPARDANNGKIIDRPGFVSRMLGTPMKKPDVR